MTDHADIYIHAETEETLTRFIEDYVPNEGRDPESDWPVFTSYVGISRTQHGFFPLGPDPNDPETIIYDPFHVYWNIKAEKDFIIEMLLDFETALNAGDIENRESLREPGKYYDFPWLDNGYGGKVYCPYTPDHPDGLIFSPKYFRRKWASGYLSYTLSAEPPIEPPDKGGDVPEPVQTEHDVERVQVKTRRSRMKRRRKRVDNPAYVGAEMDDNMRKWLGLE